VHERGVGPLARLGEPADALPVDRGGERLVGLGVVDGGVGGAVDDGLRPGRDADRGRVGQVEGGTVDPAVVDALVVEQPDPRPAEHAGVPDEQHGRGVVGGGVGHGEGGGAERNDTAAHRI